MRLWANDFSYYFARAMRTVGLGLAMVGWASVLASEAQQYNDLRSYAIVVCAILGVVVSQWFAGLPPSANPMEVARDLERDIVVVAREQARGDHDREVMLTAFIAALAVSRLREGANVPSDRRAWLRVLGRLADER